MQKERKSGRKKFRRKVQARTHHSQSGERENTFRVDALLIVDESVTDDFVDHMVLLVVVLQGVPRFELAGDAVVLYVLLLAQHTYM